MYNSIRRASPRYYTVDPMELHWGTLLILEEVLSLQPMFPPKPFDTLPLEVDAQKV